MNWVKRQWKFFASCSVIVIVALISLGLSHHHPEKKPAAVTTGMVDTLYRIDAPNNTQNVHVYGWVVINGCEYILIGNPLTGVMNWTHKGDCKNKIHKLTVVNAKGYQIQIDKD